MIPAKTEEEVEKRIADWHENNGYSIPLIEYLGWTLEQYAKFVETCEIPNLDK